MFVIVGALMSFILNWCFNQQPLWLAPGRLYVFIKWSLKWMGLKGVCVWWQIFPVFVMILKHAKYDFEL
jgi:hypothetical protein